MQGTPVLKKGVEHTALTDVLAGSTTALACIRHTARKSHCLQCIQLSNAQGPARSACYFEVMQTYSITDQQLKDNRLRLLSQL